MLNKWPREFHLELQQKRRFYKALTGNLQIVHYFKESGIAHISSIAEPNRVCETTLDDCSCSDFTKNKRPCKHMYYLDYFLAGNAETEE